MSVFIIRDATPSDVDDIFQESFMEAAGWSRCALQIIGRGGTDPRWSDFLKIAAVLGTWVSLLINWRGRPRPPAREQTGGAT